MKRNVLSFPESAFERLREHFSGDDPNERLFFGLLGLSETDHQREFIVRDTYIPEEQEYEERTPVHASLHADRVLALLQRTREHSGLLAFHNHGGAANFSVLDAIQAPMKARNTLDFIADGYHVEAIWGANGIRGFVRSRETDWEPIDLVKVAGPQSLQMFLTVGSRAPSMNYVADVDAALHDRTIGMLGEHGTRALRLMQTLRWGVVGCGGSGSAWIALAKFFGLQRLTLIDADRAEIHNANRLFGWRAGDLGERKTQIARRELTSFFGAGADLRTVDVWYPEPEAEAALKDCDVLIGAVDNDFARYELAQFAARYQKPLFDMGAGTRRTKNGRLKAGCQVRVQTPEGKCLVCNGLDTTDLVNPHYVTDRVHPGYVENGDGDTPANVVTINCVAANLCWRAILSYFGGFDAPTPSYIEYEEIGLQLADLSGAFQKQDNCPLCGEQENSIRGWGDRLPERFRVEVAPANRAAGVYVNRGAGQS